MVNLVPLMFLLFYIVGATLAVTIYIGATTNDVNAITHTLQYSSAPINNFQQDDNTTNIASYITTINGGFAWNKIIGLYATNLSTVTGIGTIAQCSFGATIVNSNTESETFILKGLSINPSDNIGILMDYHVVSSSFMSSDAYYTWLFISENNIWIQQEHMTQVLGVGFIHDTVYIANNLTHGVQVPDQSTISYSYNYNSGYLIITLNNVIIYQHITDIGYYPAGITSRPEQIRLNNLDISVMNAGTINGLAPINKDPWFYVTLFIDIAGWGIDDNILPWYFHILLISIWEIALIVYVILSAVHG
jgi:hypothetical protein